jgi:hypothetical protein
MSWSQPDCTDFYIQQPELHCSLIRFSLLITMPAEYTLTKEAPAPLPGIVSVLLRCSR